MTVDPSPTTSLDELLEDPMVDALGMLIETGNEVTNELARRIGGDTTWLGVLIRLARSPDQRLRMSELARDMTVSTSGLTRMIDRIESAGLVRREACPTDRRGLWAVLTPEGEAALGEALPDHVRDIHEVIGDALSPDEVELLTDLLRRVRNHVRTDLGGG